ncbi:MAG: protein kinase [Proteobacteria bacterium]|nr:protein kinase [Pseudomonadota bacterium]
MDEQTPVVDALDDSGDAEATISGDRWHAEVTNPGAVETGDVASGIIQPRRVAPPDAQTALASQPPPVPAAPRRRGSSPGQIPPRTLPQGSSQIPATPASVRAAPAADTLLPVAPVDPELSPRTPASAPSGSAGSGSHSTGSGAVDVRLPKPGTTIGHYELIREIGRGGMGAVYVARDTKLGRRVAIKFLISDQQEVTVRFLMEARVTAQFNHENIVVIHEADEHDGNPYMVLEFLQGQPLSRLIRKSKRLPPSRAVELMLPVARALAAAHKRNIVHRDLKPDNVFVTDAGTVKVLDFGIAKLKGLDIGVAELVEIAKKRGESGPDGAAPRRSKKKKSRKASPEDSITGPTTDLTRAGAIMGTLAYMSPEQWGIGEVDAQTDIWAVGILLFRMIAGQHPLAPLRGWELAVTANLDQPMPSVRTVAPDVSDELADIIDRCLFKEKRYRMASAEALVNALETLLPGRYGRKLRPDESPYAGLSAFQEADADRFFGRSKEIASMVSRLRDHPIIGVVGPSGVGKSSFVRAGVVPVLKASGETWETLVVRPGRTPMLALAHLVSGMVSQSSTTLVDDLTEQQAIMQRLYAEPGYLGSVLRNRARRKERKILVFIDQFEELYTMSPDLGERLAFTRCLAGVADDATTPLRIVLSIRSDFLDRVAEDPYFMAELSQSLFFLTPPNRDGLREAIVEPAQMASYEFEQERMVEDMLNHLETTPGALPLLQFTASKLWEARDSHRKLLTEHSYVQMGGVVGALASHADAVVNELAPQAQALVRAIMLRLVTPERTRALATVGDLYELSPQPADVQRLVDHLVQARLLTVHTGEMQVVGADTGPSVEIVHESLIHGWPRLRHWLDENQEDAAFLDHLRNAAKQWQNKGYAGGLLWRGDAMEEARLWHRTFRGQLPELQQAFLHETFALANRAQNRKRIAIASMFTLLTLVAVAAIVALLWIRDAEKEARMAENTANQNMLMAQSAERKVRDQLDIIQRKEAARVTAEAERKQAEDEKKQAEDEVDRTYVELEKSNHNLIKALSRARRAKRRARRQQRLAERNEIIARQAEDESRRAGDELEQALAREKKRVQKLLDQLGSDVIRDLN